ncbi:uncharacterized protein [Nicotiana sylvestris]|uniref:uncharacterized protein n=1 Tax=Nicotiana sylvestris TaxID=4096 RepID=UPI00388C6DE0
MSKPVVPKAKAPMPRPSPPYPQRLAKQNSENQFKKFIDMMKNFPINVPLVEALEQMPGYAKFMKDLVTKKRSMNCETIKITHQVSAIVQSMGPKLEDAGAFTIPCTIGSADFAKALCDIRACIDLIPYSMFKTLGIGATNTHIHEVANGGSYNEEVDYEVPIILGRPFLATKKALIDVEACELIFRVGNENLAFHMCKSMRQPNSNKVSSFMDFVNDVIINDASTTMNVEDNLKVILLNLDDDEEKEGYVKCMNALQGMGSYTYEPHKLSLDLENRKTPPTKPSIEEPPTSELKWLPPYVRCEETSLVLNWEKCHFMVEEGIVLGHKISKHGIKIDKDKIEFKLTTTPIITTPDWSLPFELMSDASDVAVGAVLGQRINKIFHPVYYASKIMNDAQVNYTVTKKELLAIVFAMEKFRPYLMGKKVNTVAASIQEFYLDIQDGNGSENQVADDLSRLEEEGRPHDGLEINDSFPDEQLLAISMTGMLWFADLANYLVSGIILNEFSSNQRKKLKRDCVDYYWDEPYLFRICTDGVIQKCVPKEEQVEILEACHSLPYGGHHGGARKATKVLSCRFYWSTFYKDASDLVKRCD